MKKWAERGVGCCLQKKGKGRAREPRTQTPGDGGKGQSGAMPTGRVAKPGAKEGGGQIGRHWIPFHKLQRNGQLVCYPSLNQGDNIAGSSSPGTAKTGDSPRQWRAAPTPRCRHSEPAEVGNRKCNPKPPQPRGDDPNMQKERRRESVGERAYVHVSPDAFL